MLVTTALANQNEIVLPLQFTGLPKQKINFDKIFKLPKAYRARHWLTIPFTVSHGSIITMISINHHKLQPFFWDTGAIPSVIRNNNELGIKAKPCPAYKKRPCQALYTTSLSVNGKPLPNTWFSLKALPKQAPFLGLIGNNFFRYHIVFINFKNKTIRIMLPTEPKR